MWHKLDIVPFCTFCPGLGTAWLRQNSGYHCLMLAQVLREKRRPECLVLSTFSQITFSPLKTVAPLERNNISEMSVILESPLHGNLETWRLRGCVLLNQVRMWLGNFSSLGSSQVLLELAPYLSLVEILGQKVVLVLTSWTPTLCHGCCSFHKGREFLLCLLLSPQHESLEHGKCPMNPLSNESVVPFNLQKQLFEE